jgi:hypothetical protein
MSAGAVQPGCWSSQATGKATMRNAMMAFMTGV